MQSDLAGFLGPLQLLRPDVVDPLAIYLNGIMSLLNVQLNVLLRSSRKIRKNRHKPEVVFVERRSAFLVDGGKNTDEGIRGPERNRYDAPDP